MKGEQPRYNLPLAIGMIIFTVLSLSLGDALIKMTSSNFVIWQIFVIRSLIVIPFLVLYLYLRNIARPSLPSVIAWMLVRSLLLVLMWVCYYVSLPRLSLSIAAATYYTLPIFITLFSAVLLGEKVSRQGWLALVLGFVGVLFILRPTAESFNWFIFLPLLSAILYALAMILTHSKCREENPIVLSLALNLTFVAVGAVVAVSLLFLPNEARHGFIFAPWTAMGAGQWLAMSLLAIALFIGSVGTAIAYQNGPPSIVGIFDFSYVGFAVVWGVVFFADIPDGMSVIGMMLVVAAGLVSLRK